jgi:hypothetical protein
MTSLDDSPQRQHYALTFAALALAGLTFALLQSLVAPARPEIQRDLHASAPAAASLGVPRDVATRRQGSGSLVADHA